MLSIHGRPALTRHLGCGRRPARSDQPSGHPSTSPAFRVQHKSIDHHPSVQGTVPEWRYFRARAPHKNRGLRWSNLIRSSLLSSYPNSVGVIFSKKRVDAGGSSMDSLVSCPLRWLIRHSSERSSTMNFVSAGSTISSFKAAREP